MPKSNNLPKALRPYAFHGLHLTEGSGDEAVADCPWCHREGKFTVNSESGLWRCLGCNEGSDNGKVTRGGNTFSFLRKLWDISYASTTDYKDLIKSRGLLQTTTPAAWHIAKSVITGEWLVPGFSASGALVQLSRYIFNPVKKTWFLAVTPEFNRDAATGEEKLFHGLYGRNLWDGEKDEVYVCEGVWDGMALWETLGATRLSGDDFQATANQAVSLLKESNVLAIPSCNVFGESWLQLFEGKIVTLLFDSDHPRASCATCKKGYSTVTYKECPICHNPSTGGPLVHPAGWEGTRRVAEMLLRSNTPPKEVHVLRWGPEGFDPSKKNGYDVRDALTADLNPAKRSMVLLPELMKHVTPVPPDWAEGRTDAAKRKGGTEIELLPCKDFKTLRQAWRLAFKWSHGHDGALISMLATAASTDLDGDQLWLRLIGPPSSGKTSFADALSTNKKYVKALSTLTGFHSGYKAGKDDTEDHSLIPKIDGKTLIIKDGDTILQSDSKDRILSEARDLYDGATASFYRHDLNKDYANHRTTVILCGTGSLRLLDTSELGERFLTWVLMDRIDRDMERDISLKKIYAVRRLLTRNGSVEQHGDGDEVKARQLTGGYIGYLRQNVKHLLAEVDMPDVVAEKVHDLALYVAHMRARPSTKQDEVTERELSARLSSQLTRYTLLATVVLNKKVVDEEVLALTRKVALDTGEGRTSRICSRLAKLGYQGASAKSLAVWTTETEQKLRDLMGFLQNINVVKKFEYKGATGGTKIHYRLTDDFQALWLRVFPETEVQGVPVAGGGFVLE